MRDWLQAGDSWCSGRQLMLGWCSTLCMLYSVDAVLCVCCTRCWLLIMGWRDRDGWLNFVFLGDGRGDGKNHHEKLGLTRILCASRFTIPDPAGTSPDSACNNTDTRSSQPNQASRPPDIPYLLISSTSFSFSSPISLFLIHISTIIAEHKVNSSLSISPCHDHELTPSTASTQDCLSSLHSHDYELTPECRFSFRRASLHDRPPPASSLWELKSKVTLSHSHGCKLTNWWIESQHRAGRPSTASKYSSNLTWSSKYISKLARLLPPSASPNLLNHSHQVYLQTWSITASKFPRSRPPSASLTSLDPGLQAHVCVHSIAASKCISQLARSRPPSTLLVSDSRCTEIQGWRRWTFTRSSSSGTPRIADNHRVLPVQLYRV